MEKKDVADVSHLLAKVFRESGLSQPEWQETIDWLYFSPEIKDGVPRAFVVANEQSIVGHVGLTLSTCTHGDQSFKVVQPSNWVMDPDQKAGLLALRLILDATSLGDAAIVIGGSPDTRRIIPKIGFKKQQELGRYIKVMRPGRFLWMARTGEQFVRNTAKLSVFLASSLLHNFTRPTNAGRQVSTLRYQMLETNGQAVNPHHALASDAEVGSQEKRSVLRNSLNAEFLNWYKQCPRGRVHVLRFFRDGVIMGQAAVIIKSRKGNCYANVLNVDARTDDAAAWIQLLDGVEDFLRDKNVTHVNAIGAYEPWCRALKSRGYCRLKRMPFWLRDKSRRLADVNQWHITAIEGDLGFLFE